MSRIAGFSNAESRARNAEQTALLQKDRRAALEATINATELYMKALRLAPNPVDRKRVDAKCNELLLRAERLKSSENGPSSSKTPQRAVVQDSRQPEPNRKLTTRENIILLEGSKLNGFIFKPWTSSPLPEEFDLREGESLFVDAPELPLSPCQMETFAGWMRPREALARIEIKQNGILLPNEPTMGKSDKIDLVQDMTSDCSVVASLCAGTARAERGHPKILGSIVHPYDHLKGQPIFSRSGKYILRLYFNGCWRRVEIDDLLPTSTNSRVLHVIDRAGPGLLWPALIEKAYLKVRGGYDFPGSNSGTDIAVLTGWIPQQIFLHDEGVEPEELWTRIFNGFKRGDLFLTMGTGKLPEREQRLFGLAAEHDYSVLEMKETNELRELLIKNPWSDGDVWRGAARRRPNPSHESTPELGPDEEGLNREKSLNMTPGTFWMDFGSVFQHFENLYVNWNPQLFSTRQDVHFSWDLSKSDRVPGLFFDNPQFAISSQKGGTVWLLLNKHLRTGDYSHERQGRNGYISLYIYDRKGHKVISTDGAKVRGPFVDSPNTLLIFDLPATGPFTAVVASQDLPLEKFNFTLSAFSNMPIDLNEAMSNCTHEDTVSAAWTRSTAGGNSDMSSYLVNPQFSLKVDVSHKIALVLRLASPSGDAETDIHVKFLVIASDGRRVTRIRPRDILAHSGDYRRGSAVIEVRLAAGNYTLICSTFDRAQYAKFTLTLHTASPQHASLRSLPSESSGRLSISSASAVFQTKTGRLLAPITLAKVTKAIFILQCAAHQSGNSKQTASSSLFKMTLEQGQGPYKLTLATSAVADTEFISVNAGVRIEDTDLLPSLHAPGMGGLWLVLERLVQSSSERREDELLKVEILADERLDIGPWGLGDG